MTDIFMSWAWRSFWWIGNVGHPPNRSVVIFGAATELIVIRSRLNQIYVALNETYGCSKNKHHTTYGPIDNSFYPLFSPGVVFGKYFLVRRILFWFDMLAFSLFFKKLTQDRTHRATM